MRDGTDLRRRGRTEHLAIPRRLKAGFMSVVALSAVLNLLQLAIPIYSMQIYDRVLPSGNMATLLALSIIVGAVVLAASIIDGARSVILVRLANQLDIAWRPNVLNACFSIGSNTGALRDLDGVRSFVSGPVTIALLDLPWSLVFVGTIFALDVRLGALTALGCAAILAVAMLGERSAHSRTADAQAANSGAHLLFDVSLANLDALKSMGGIGAAQEEITRRSLRALHSQTISLDRQLWAAAAGRGCRNILQILLLGLAAGLAVGNEIPGGIIVASSMLFMRAMAPVERVAFGWRAASSVRAGLARLRELADRAGPVERRLSLPSLRGRLEVVGLTGGMPERQQPIVVDVCFSVEPGEILAVVGKSGAGKSTLVRLVVGALRPWRGSVRLDAAALGDVDPDEAGRQIGYLPQDLQLLDGTVAEAIARSSAIDDRKVVTAAQLAGVHEMILRLPRGYQTRLGPAGCHLSFGERQRICIARALYGAPPLVVLDEPTAHLDDGGEKLFLATLQALKAARTTVLVVTKSASVMRTADLFLMLERGRVRVLQRSAEIHSASGQPLATERDAADFIEAQA